MTPTKNRIGDPNPRPDPDPDPHPHPDRDRSFLCQLFSNHSSAIKGEDLSDPCDFSARHFVIVQHSSQGVRGDTVSEMAVATFNSSAGLSAGL